MDPFGVEWSTGKRLNLMKHPNEYPNQHGPEDPASGLTAGNAVPFYLILIAAVLLPFLLVACVLFAQVAATIFLATVGLVLVGSLIYAYREAGRQMREFQNAIRQLPEKTGDQEISVLGGVLKVRIEQQEIVQPTIPALSDNQTGHQRESSRDEADDIIDVERE